jgi:hypothetical protein
MAGQRKLHVISIPSADSSHTTACILSRWRVFSRWKASVDHAVAGVRNSGLAGFTSGRGFITLKSATEIAYFELDDCSGLSRHRGQGSVAHPISEIRLRPRAGPATVRFADHVKAHDEMFA